MKLAAVLLAILNTLPLSVYPFVVLPLAEIAFSGDQIGETALSHYFGYGFIWGALLYPLLLIFNHVAFIRNRMYHAHGRALFNQLTTFVYVSLIIIYGFLAIRLDS